MDYPGRLKWKGTINQVQEQTHTLLHALRQETPAQVAVLWETTASEQHFLLHLSNEQKYIAAPDLFPML